VIVIERIGKVFFIVCNWEKIQIFAVVFERQKMNPKESAKVL